MLDATLARIAARPRLSILAGLSAGIVAAMGQAPFGFAPAMVLGLFAGFALFRAARDVRHAAVLGWALGAGYFGLTLFWIVQPFMVDVARHGWMAPFALVLLAGGLALFWGAGAGLARWLTPRPYGWIAWAVCLSAMELLRGWVFTGFPWGEPGLAWVDTPLRHLAAHVGTSGLTFLTFLFAAALYVALHGRRWVLHLVLVLALFAGALGLGYQRGQGAQVADTDKILRLIQPNAAQHLKWDPDHAPEFVQRQLEMTSAPADIPPDLMIWPETAIPYLLTHAEPLLEDIANRAGVPVVLGLQRSEGPRYFNSMVVLGDGGAVTALYDKHHLVPFGEYIPAGDLMARLGLRGFAAQQGYGYSPGPGARLIDIDGFGPVLPLICYEAIFARDLRGAEGRPGWILQLTNDAWFGTFSGPQQHLVQARMRAVEMGLPFVRAANTGISAVIDAGGDLRGTLPLNQSGLLDVPLPGSLPETVFARNGNLSLTVLLIIAGLGLIVRRGAKRIDPATGRM